MTKEQRKKRTRIGVGIIIAVFVSLALYLVKIQIIDGDEYKAASANLAVTQTTIKAATVVTVVRTVLLRHSLRLVFTS